MWLSEKNAIAHKRAMAVPVVRKSRVVAAVKPTPCHGNARGGVWGRATAPDVLIDAPKVSRTVNRSTVIKADGRVLSAKPTFERPTQHIIRAPKKLARLVDARGRAL